MYVDGGERNTRFKHSRLEQFKGCSFTSEEVETNYRLYYRVKGYNKTRQEIEAEEDKLRVLNLIGTSD